MGSVNFDDLCDLVVVEDYLIYITKCMAKSEYAKYEFGFEKKTGEIWVINLLDNVMFKVQSNLFLPKSIAYMRTADVIAVTNLAADGLSLYKRERDLSLTKISDINLDSFVINIHADAEDTLWLVLHPVLYETIRFFDRFDTTMIPSRVLKLKIDIKNGKLINYYIEKIFSTNGSLLNALGSSVFYNEFLILFSFISDPKVCSL